MPRDHGVRAGCHADGRRLEATAIAGSDPLRAARPLRLAQGLLEIAEAPKAHDRDRVAAIREVLDRGWGKAPAFAAMESDDPLELSEIAREIQEITDELSARREAKP
jgi:hypothetical protein